MFELHVTIDNGQNAEVLAAGVSGRDDVTRLFSAIGSAYLTAGTHTINITGTQHPCGFSPDGPPGTPVGTVTVADTHGLVSQS